MHEESLIPNPLGIPADSNQLGNPLVHRRQISGWVTPPINLQGGVQCRATSGALTKKQRLPASV